MAAAYMHEFTDLIKECADGDQKSQRELYNLLKGELMGICYRYSKSQEDANDVFQESMIKLFKNINQALLVDNFEGWVRRITVNVAIDAFKKNKSQAFRSLEEEDVVEFSSDNINALDRLQSEEILILIKQLPYRQMIVFNMYGIDGYSHKEISEKLNVAEGASRMLLSRARKSMIRILSKIEANEKIC